jgi:hypothetical protein
MVTRFCDQLDRKIHEAEGAGLLEEIDVIDLTMDDPPDTSDGCVDGLAGTKRASGKSYPGWAHSIIELTLMLGSTRPFSVVINNAG